jgi:hypothetical protein
VVRKGSKYFPGGRMIITVDIRFIEDEHVAPVSTMTAC